jgi:hypothetical protein
MTSNETLVRSLTTRTDPAVNSAINRLTTEFAEDLPQPVVRRVVLSSRRDLNGSPAAALPELVERLARQRLSSLRARTEEAIR